MPKTPASTFQLTATPGKNEARAMILAWLIMTLSMGMVFFYFQATCQKILRRQFDREYF